MPYKVITDSFLVKDDSLRHLPYISEDDFFQCARRDIMRKTICLLGQTDFSADCMRIKRQIERNLYYELYVYAFDVIFAFASVLHNNPCITVQSFKEKDQL